MIRLIVILSFALNFCSLYGQETQISPKAAKYHEILKKRPDGGYLFDRFYNAWLETDTTENLGKFLAATAKATSSDPDSSDSLLLGWFHVKQGKDSEALKTFSEALVANPNNAAAWFEKAKIEARNANLEGAISDLDSAAKSTAKKDLQIKIAKLKGRLLIRSGKNEESIAAWRKLIAENPGDEELREDLVELLLDEGLFEEAVKTSRELVALTKDPYQKVVRQLRTGDIFQRNGKQEEALAEYEAALGKTGGGSWIEKEILSQIEQIFRREDNLIGLNEYLKKLEEKDAQRLNIAQRRAVLLIELGETDEAVKLFSTLLSKTPGDRRMRENYIDLLSNAENLDKAVSEMETLAAQNDGDEELVVSLATLQQRAGKKDDALKSLARYLEKAGETEYTLARVAQLQEKFEATEPAEATHRKLVAQNPESVGARESFASFLYRIEKKKEALEIWRKLGTEGNRDQIVRIARTLGARSENEAALESSSIPF